MDLSNLSSDLPPTRAIDQISVSELNQELTAEFKNAAKSVASLYNSSILGNGKEQKTEFTNAAKSVTALYRLSSNSNDLLLNKGYLECLDDLLENIAKGEDIENWALTKRAEITNVHRSQHERADATNINKSQNEKAEVKSQNDTEDTTKVEKPAFEIPENYDFSLNPSLASTYKFTPGFPPLSVTHSTKFANHLKKTGRESMIRRKLRIQNSNYADDSTTSSEYESELEDLTAEEKIQISEAKLRSRSRDDDGCRKRRKVVSSPTNHSDLM